MQGCRQGLLTLINRGSQVHQRMHCLMIYALDTAIDAAKAMPSAGSQTDWSCQDLSEGGANNHTTDYQLAHKPPHSLNAVLATPSTQIAASIQLHQHPTTQPAHAVSLLGADGAWRRCSRLCSWQRLETKLAGLVARLGASWRWCLVGGRYLGLLGLGLGLALQS